MIEPSGPWPGLDFRELWRYRGLFWFLVWRDIKVRYAQTVLGAAWAVVQPVVTMVVFTVIFGRLLSVSSDGSPYAIFSLTALVPWTYFSGTLGTTSSSLISNPALVTKIYFPRLVIPVAAVLAKLLDLGIAFLILLVMLAVYGTIPSPAALVVVPYLVVVLVATAIGVGSFLAALNTRYRDVGKAVQFMIQLWMYASPIIYPISSVPEGLRPWYALNPMVGIIEGFRSVLIGSRPIPVVYIAISTVMAGAALLAGTLYFRRLEKTFADVA